jgi:hypothetical protein
MAASPCSYWSRQIMTVVLHTSTCLSLDQLRRVLWAGAITSHLYLLLFQPIMFSMSAVPFSYCIGPATTQDYSQLHICPLLCCLTAPSSCLLLVPMFPGLARQPYVLCLLLVQTTQVGEDRSTHLAPQPDSSCDTSGSRLFFLNRT